MKNVVHINRQYGPNKKRSCSSAIVSLVQNDRNLQAFTT